MRRNSKAQRDFFVSSDVFHSEESAVFLVAKVPEPSTILITESWYGIKVPAVG
jgi:hypothetical protein